MNEEKIMAIFRMLGMKRSHVGSGLVLMGLRGRLRRPGRLVGKSARFALGYRDGHSVPTWKPDRRIVPPAKRTGDRRRPRKGTAFDPVDHRFVRQILLL